MFFTIYLIKEIEMRIPARFAPLLFSALLSAIMVCIVSAFVLVISQGIHPGFINQWVKSCLTTWPVAFPTVAIVAPLVRQIVTRVTVPVNHGTSSTPIR